ncbi:MAG: hypothetical protein ACK56I_32995, partial [bacterium]
MVRRQRRRGGRARVVSWLAGASNADAEAVLVLGWLKTSTPLWSLCGGGLFATLDALQSNGN